MLSLMIEWKEILSSEKEALISLGAELLIHPLALEDCLHRNQRAKLEDYENHQFLVWFLYTDKKIYELQFLIFPHLLLLVAHEPPPKGKTWKEFLSISEDPREVPQFLHHILDHITDLTSIEIRNLFEKIQRFEQELFKGETEIRSILPVRKKLSAAELQLGHLPSVTLQLQNFFNSKGNLRWKFRDLHDHNERLYQSILFHQGQIVSAFELHWAISAQKTNLQIKKLTLLASVAVPLTFWASFWGMNFEAIPFESTTFFAFAMVVMFGSVLSLYFILRKKGYWTN